MSGWLLLLVFVGAILLVIFSGHPFALALGGVTIWLGLALVDPSVFHLATGRMWQIVVNFVLIAIPLFIYMGDMLARSGVGEDLYDAMYTIMGPIKGGLAIGTIMIGAILATCTGIVGSGVVLAALLALPPMLKRDYQKALALGSVGASGTLGILIPPSIMLVCWGGMAGASVGKLFMGAFMPGFLLAFVYMVYIAIRSQLQPDIAPALPKEERRISAITKGKLAMVGIVPVMVLILAVLGSIFLGLATPTEAAALGCMAAILLTAAKRRLSWHIIKESCYSTARITSMIGMIFLGALPICSVFIAAGGETAVTEILEALGMGPWGTVGLILIIVVLMGCFMDWIAIVVICITIFLPIAVGLGFDPTWFGVLIAVTLQTAFMTPPFGGALIYLRGVSPPEVTMKETIIGFIPFIGVQLVVIALCCLFPNIILWLPSKMVV